MNEEEIIEKKIEEIKKKLHNLEVMYDPEITDSLDFIMMEDCKIELAQLEEKLLKIKNKGERIK